ncbi:hypothetical protein JB92DRAFT_2649515, partial [Gautieria morchelliformis]
VLWERTGLLDERWEGTPDEERNAYVSELLDSAPYGVRTTNISLSMDSANLNDRSQKCDGDSEIALVVEGTDEIESRMDGRPVRMFRVLVAQRRLHKFPEHLGLIAPQPVASSREPVDSFIRPAPRANADETTQPSESLVADTLLDEILSLWGGTAKTNRDIFTEVFRP